MKIIKELENLISDEIEDIEKYARMALELKYTHPAVARTLYEISTQEHTHQSMLHAEVVRIIENHRKEHGEPPAAMMAVYEYIHKQHIENLAKARRYQDMYKNE